MSGDILSVFAVPPVMLGSPPAPRSALERGEILLAMTFAAGLDPFALGPEIQRAAMRRWMIALGVQP